MSRFFCGLLSLSFVLFGSSVSMAATYELRFQGTYVSAEYLSYYAFLSEPLVLTFDRSTQCQVTFQGRTVNCNFNGYSISLDNNSAKNLHIHNFLNSFLDEQPMLPLDILEFQDPDDPSTFKFPLSKFRGSNGFYVESGSTETLIVRAQVKKI